MQIIDMSADWYASKNAQMMGEIHQSHTYLIMHHQDRAFKHRSTMTTSQFNFNSSTAGPGYYYDNKMLVHDETY